IVDHLVRSTPNCCWRVRWAQIPRMLAEAVETIHQERILTGRDADASRPPACASMTHFLRAFAFNAVGGTQPHDRHIGMYRPSPLHVSQVDGPASLNVSGLMNLVVSYLIPPADVPQARSLDQLAGTRWLSVTEACRQQSAGLIISARSSRVDERLRAYVR